MLHLIGVEKQVRNIKIGWALMVKNILFKKYIKSNNDSNFITSSIVFDPWVSTEF